MIEITRLELFIEHGDVALRRTHEQLGGHPDEDAIVTGGVIAQRVAQLCVRMRLPSGIDSSRRSFSAKAA
jgi:hypothetical protein